MSTSLMRLAVAGAILATPGAAAAHATLEEANAKAGSMYKAVMRVPHGCDGQATHTLSIQLPNGFIAAKPMPKAGWDLKVKQGPYDQTYDYFGTAMSEGPVEVVWSGGQLEDFHYDEFVVRGRIVDMPDGTALAFPTTQICADGEVSWSELAAPGQDPHDLDRPAPILMVSSSAHEGHGGHGGHGSSDTSAAIPEPVIVGDLKIEASWTRATPPGARVGAGYLVITNTGDEPDVLVGGSAPFASLIEIHEMSMIDGTMRMRPIDGGLVIAPGATEKLQPGGNHVMFMGLTEGIEEGSPVIATLEFERAGTVELMFTPGPMGGGSPFGGDDGAHGGGHGHGNHSHSN